MLHWRARSSLSYNRKPMQRYLNDSQAFLSTEFDNRRLRNVEKGCESMGLHYEQVSINSQSSNNDVVYLPPFDLWCLNFLSLIIEVLSLNSSSFVQFLPLKVFVCETVCVAMFQRGSVRPYLPPSAKRVRCLYVYYQPSLCPSLFFFLNYCLFLLRFTCHLCSKPIFRNFVRLNGFETDSEETDMPLRFIQANTSGEGLKIILLSLQLYFTVSLLISFSVAKVCIFQKRVNYTSVRTHHFGEIFFKQDSIISILLSVYSHVTRWQE